MNTYLNGAATWAVKQDPQLATAGWVLRPPYPLPRAPSGQSAARSLSGAGGLQLREVTPPLRRGVGEQKSLARGFHHTLGPAAKVGLCCVAVSGGVAPRWAARIRSVFRACSLLHATTVALGVCALCVTRAKQKHLKQLRQ